MRKQKPLHDGSITFAFDSAERTQETRIFLIKNAPRNVKDRSRRRKRVGINKWMPPGGGRNPSDWSQKHGAQRELYEESGRRWKIPLGNLRRVGVLECYKTAKGSPRSFERATLKWVVHLYETVIPEWLYTSKPARPSKGISKVQWFPIYLLPWHEMLDDVELWIPRMINGEQLRVRILRHYRTGRLMSHEIIPEQFSR
ncbi:MAG: NUDIX domain-containing protein [Candidatus Pacebacteria bacterium]|nr:NUDIX domain-containing protein [Candidatus Paceibacterota bacterium]